MGEKIAEKWRTLGRRLGIKDPELEDIDQLHKQLSEKGYQILKLWKRREGSAATHQALCDALKRVKRKDLAQKFCCIEGNIVELTILNGDVRMTWETYFPSLPLAPYPGVPVKKSSLPSLMNNEQ